MAEEAHSWKALILEADDLPREEVTEWGLTFWLRTLTGEERDKFEQRMHDMRKDDRISVIGMKAYLIILCAVDDGGESIFAPTDLQALQLKSGAVLDRLWQIAQKLNHLLPEDVKALAGN